MRHDFTLRPNADGTATFRARRPDGRRYVEHFDVRDKGLVETYEAIRWSAVTAGLPLGEDMLEDLMREVRGLKGEET